MSYMRKKTGRELAREQKAVEQALAGVALHFTGDEAVTSFVQHVLTDAERTIIGRRLAVARMILSGATYFDVYDELTISPNTFRNVRHWLDRELPDYNDVLIENKRRAAARAAKKFKRAYKQRPRPFSLADLKQRYPAHFLLFNLTEELVDLYQQRRTAKSQHKQ